MRYVELGEYEALTSEEMVGIAGGGDGAGELFYDLAYVAGRTVKNVEAFFEAWAAGTREGAAWGLH
jgi:hypothetical protein